MIAQVNSDYSQVEYWDRRYQKESFYEWFKGYDQLGTFLEKHIPKTASVLHLGCGNSHLSIQMYDQGWLDQTNIDYSSTVIKNMSAEFGNVKWICGDIFSMDSYLDKKYDIAIDKGTLDALLTVKHDPWNPDIKLKEHIRNYVDQIVSALEPNGIYIHITWSQPHFRKIFLSHPHLDVQVNKLCSESDSFEFSMKFIQKHNLIKELLFDNSDLGSFAVTLRGPMFKMERESSLLSIKLEPNSLSALNDNTVSTDEVNQTDFQEYLSDTLKTRKRKESDPGLPSNNSSRTFFEKSNPGSPQPSKSLSEPVLSAECMPPYVSDANPYDYHHPDAHAQDQPYHVSPFNFNYDGTQEDYLKYRSGNFASHPYDMSYMQQLTQLSSHWEELNPQHCNIPIGRRRPRPIMISGENTENLRKMYEQPLEDYPHQPEEKDVYSIPMGVTPGRYYYSNRTSQYPDGLIGGHELAKADVNHIGLLSDAGNPLSRSVFNYDSNAGESIHCNDHISTANLSIEQSSNQHTHNIIPRSKSTKTLGKRQKHVRKACIHCKKAHLACDEARPCKRCLHLGKPDCIDVEHKRRGRPRSSPEKKRPAQISTPQEYTEAHFGGNNLYPPGTQGVLNLSGIELDKTE